MSGVYKNVTAIILVGLLLNPLWSAPAQASSDSYLEAFIDRVASSVYSMAWPTATYRSVNLNAITERSNGSLDIAFRLYGISALDNSGLWTDVVLNVKDGAVRDIKWGKNNAIVMPPGATATLVGEFLAELSAELQKANNHFGFYVQNKCSHPVKLAITYKDVNGNMRSTGWWNFEPNTKSHLADAAGKRLATKSADWYFYAESTDKSGLVWKGNYTFSVERQPVSMMHLKDSDGDSDLVMICD